MNTLFPQSAPVRTGEELAAYKQIDERVRQIALAVKGREAQYPALIATDVLERAEYPQAFPHLLMFAGRLQCPEAAMSRSDLTANQAPTEWCLSPAVCYHVYAHLSGCVLPEPSVITARGTCFRQERDFAPGIRQVEFGMREIVLLGSSDWVHAAADSVVDAITSLANELGLVGVWCAAADPFFLPAAKGKAMMQRLMGVKHEFQLLDPSGLALGSVNRHGQFFGRRFHITTPDGEPVHTACVAVGLDRWSHAVGLQRETQIASRVDQEVRS